LNKEDLIKKLEDIEWEDFEVKEAQKAVPKNSWETVSAFSNTVGGWLIFGVKKSSQSYEIKGVNNPEKIEQEFTTVLRGGSKFNKIVEVTCKKYQFNGKTVLAFYIPQKSIKDKPIYFNSRKNTFIRTASGDQRATDLEIDALFRNSSYGEKDSECTNYVFSDLDSDTIQRYRNYFSQVNPGHRYNGLENETFLEKLRVIVNGKITYGGLLVFGTDLQVMNAFPNFRTEYLEVPGISYMDGPTTYTFRISSEKNLFETFFDIYDRLRQKVEIPFKLKDGLRDDDPLQLQAIREALVNLIMHTDYFSSGNSRIRVFTDRFEFFNPGCLPKDIKDILKEDFSHPRNPIVAKIFRFIRLSETVGNGFHKMIDGWKSYYNVEPVIEGSFDYYKITFPITQKTTQITTQKTTQKIIELIRRNPKITRKELAQEIGDITEDGIKYNIEKLKKEGILKRVGPAKGGHWKIEKEN
jgi:ATP-dependent DNA helicase RecG